MMQKKWRTFITYITGKERCPHVLALSCSVGFYIAFSPFPGFHTGMAIVAAWGFSLNMAVIFAVSCAVNNPWTMMPIYGIDYVLGNVVFEKILHIQTSSWNPAWMISVNTWLAARVGMPYISLWSFLLGGNILGIGGAIILYPLARRGVKRVLTIPKNKTTRKHDEDYSKE